MMIALIAALSVAQVAQGLVPDMGVDNALMQRMHAGRKLLEAGVPDSEEREEGRDDDDDEVSDDSCSAKFEQCGGKEWDGPTCCSAGNTCQESNEWYSQCRPEDGPEMNFEEEPDTTADELDSASSPESAEEEAISPTPESVIEETGFLGDELLEDAQPPAEVASAFGGDDGEFVLCITGTSQTFGPTVEQREWPDQGSAVTITSEGTCTWEEYAGGFDGFPSPLVGDDHEKGMDMAIEQMFPNNRDKQNAFLQAMIAIAQPVDLDYPKDKERADNGERMNNIRKLDAACSQLITISCEQDS